jgi:hypothetical protein
MTKPTGRPRGRPKGSKDFRPKIIEFAKQVFKAEGKNWKEYFKELTPKEKLVFLKDVGQMGLAASPKTIDGEMHQIVLVMDGMVQKSTPIETSVIEHEVLPEPATALKAPPKTYRDDTRFPSGPQKESSPDLITPKPAPEPTKKHDPRSIPRNNRADLPEEIEADEMNKPIRGGGGVNEGKP